MALKKIKAFDSDENGRQEKYIGGMTMGQYWVPVNLDKKEFVHPHTLATGLKLWEQLANHPGTGAALVILCAAQREMRGGGDLDYGDEDEYIAVARRTIGRWAGDRIALVGDYAEDADLPASETPASTIYAECFHEPSSGIWIDISDDVCRVIEHELRGQFEGDGWRSFKRKGG